VEIYNKVIGGKLDRIYLAGKNGKKMAARDAQRWILIGWKRLWGKKRRHKMEWRAEQSRAEENKTIEQVREGEGEGDAQVSGRNTKMRHWTTRSGPRRMSGMQAGCDSRLQTNDPPGKWLAERQPGSSPAPPGPGASAQKAKSSNLAATGMGSLQPPRPPGNDWLATIVGRATCWKDEYEKKAQQKHQNIETSKHENLITW
jgi:hypothetical protein